MLDIEMEIAEYELMIDLAIRTNDKESLKLWRRALQTAKIIKRRLVELT